MPVTSVATKLLNDLLVRCDVLEFRFAAVDRLVASLVTIPTVFVRYGLICGTATEGTPKSTPPPTMEGTTENH